MSDGEKNAAAPEGPAVVVDGKHYLRYDAIVLERLKGHMPRFAMHYFYQGKKLCTQNGGAIPQGGTIRLEGIVGHLGITPTAH
ncbi:MAG: hypothetical protein JWP84_1203 [Tardiphaga sp.]|jgi:hypothetical protein|nr:hypothetical protein [Tardiphaga sp.]